MTNNSVPPLAKQNMPVKQYLSEGFKSVNWLTVALYGVGAGLVMPLALTQNSVFSVVAGVVPVTIGLLLARSAKGYFGLLGFLTGVIGAVTCDHDVGSVDFCTRQRRSRLGLGSGFVVGDEHLAHGKWVYFVFADSILHIRCFDLGPDGRTHA
jgi:hypothetical protein